MHGEFGNGTVLAFLPRDELRNEFEYAVIHGAVAGISSEAEVLGRLADGIILVLEAHSTRRATARKIKQTLEGAQLESWERCSVREDFRFRIEFIGGCR